MMDATLNEGLMQSIAQTIGLTHDGFRLLISLFAGYPLAFIHRMFIFGKPPDVQHIYFIVSGLLIAYFNFGFECIHPILNVLIIYILLALYGGTRASIAAAFCINMTYLTIGYYSLLDRPEVIIWATPQCVITLRLTAVVLDVYDGKKKPENLSADNKETALEKSPSLLEMMGHVFYFGGFLVGPQFSMKRYRDFVHGKIHDKVTGGPPASAATGLARLSMGLVYVLVFLIGDFFWPQAYLLTKEFETSSMLYKCWYILIWGKITLYKYISCWLITEGSSIVTGLTYNGKDRNGNELWDGCTNIQVWLWESGCTFNEIIRSFNHNTNTWMSRYVFKRLRFLGSKSLSHLITLIFLAAWHGLHSGYYMTFVLEFLMVTSENKLADFAKRNTFLNSINTMPSLQPALWGLKKAITQFGLSYSLVAFCFLKTRLWLQVYSSVYFIGHVIFVFILLGYGAYFYTNLQQKRKLKYSKSAKKYDDISKDNNTCDVRKSEVTVPHDITMKYDVTSPSDVPFKRDVTSNSDVISQSDDVPFKSDLISPSDVSKTPNVSLKSDVTTPSDVMTPSDVTTPSDVMTPHDLRHRDVGKTLHDVTGLRDVTGDVTTPGFTPARPDMTMPFDVTGAGGGDLLKNKSE